MHLFIQKTVTYFSDLKPLHSWPNKQQMHEGKKLFLIKNYQVSLADSLLGICVCVRRLSLGDYLEAASLRLQV